MKILRRCTLVFILLGTAGVWTFLLWLEQWSPPREQPYSLIEDGLYLGRAVKAPPPHTTAVLNLCRAEDSYSCEVQLWEPIHDAEPAPSTAWLRRMVTWIDTQRRAGRTTYVHCRNGVSRGGMVVVAYVMFAKGLTRDEALALVRSRRPVVQPNPAFLELLLEWQRELRQRA
jgi:hypothetical protein